MKPKQLSTQALDEQRQASKVRPIQARAGTKKSSPAAVTTQEEKGNQKKSPALVRERNWTAEQLARAPKLTKIRLSKVRQLLIG